jgi:hypothetical protein
VSRCRVSGRAVLTTTEGPERRGSEVVRQWAGRFAVQGAPDLEIGGPERALFRDGRIQHLEVTLGEAVPARLMGYAARYVAGIRA